MNIKINTTLKKELKKAYGSKISKINLQNIAYSTLINGFSHLQITWPDVKGIELSVLFCNNSEIQNLNSQFRGKNYPTNVLSFPQFEPFTQALVMSANEKSVYIGDIAVSVETIETECTQQNKSFSHHLSHMIVHSVLHLVGFDHIDDDEAAEMESIEISVLQGLGIPNPYTSGSTNFI